MWECGVWSVWVVFLFVEFPRARELWIPAFAGMTDDGVVGFSSSREWRMMEWDSRLRGNGGVFFSCRSRGARRITTHNLPEKNQGRVSLYDGCLYRCWRCNDSTFVRANRKVSKSLARNRVPVKKRRASCLVSSRDLLLDVPSLTAW